MPLLHVTRDPPALTKQQSNLLCGVCSLEKGTTYNSYIIFGEDYTALVDASHEKFRSLYLDTLAAELKKAGREKIDYIIVSHTEPDHSGLIPDLLDLHPDVVVAGSKVCSAAPCRNSVVCRPCYTSCIMHRTEVTCDVRACGM